jgi:hypothetical protein
MQIFIKRSCYIWIIFFTFSLTNPAMRFISSIYEKDIWIIVDNRLAGACKKRAEKAEINAKTR